MATSGEDEATSYVVSEVYNEEAGRQLHRDSNQKQEDVLKQRDAILPTIVLRGFPAQVCEKIGLEIFVLKA